MIKYTEILNNEKVVSIQKINEDNSISFIPLDSANSDYQRYLRWLENPEAEENGTIS